MHYFAYGSNMSLRRLAARVPSAQFVSAATLSHRQLRFHKPSHDGSSKCDAFETGEPNHSVWGVVFDIAPREADDLDAIEGCGISYERQWVDVETAQGSSLRCMTYRALLTHSHALPYCWYLQHLVIGAGEHQLPDTYQQILLNYRYQNDPDAQRRQRELAIYTEVPLAGPETHARNKKVPSG